MINKFALKRVSTPLCDASYIKNVLSHVNNKKKFNFREMKWYENVIFCDTASGQKKTLKSHIFNDSQLFTYGTKNQIEIVQA